MNNLGRRRERRAKRSDKKKRRRVTIGVLILTALVALYFSPLGPRAGSRNRHDPLPRDLVTFLVMGVDERETDGGRADTMIVVSYNTKLKELAMLSIPRDTWVNIPDRGYDKINHSYAFGKEKLAVRTVEDLLAIPIDHYVTINFQGFQKVIDGLGGIEVDVEKPLYYKDPADKSMGPNGLVIDISPGRQQMDGTTALKYARFRMDAEGDIGRIRRQQEVMQAVMAKAARPAAVTSLPALASAVKTDMSVADMVKFAGGGREALTKPAKTGTFKGSPRSMGGIFYFIPNLVEQRAAAYELLAGTPPSQEYLAQAERDQIAYDQALVQASQQAPVIPVEEPAPDVEEEPVDDQEKTPVEDEEPTPSLDIEDGDVDPNAPGDGGDDTGEPSDGTTPDPDAPGDGDTPPGQETDPPAETETPPLDDNGTDQASGVFPNLARPSAFLPKR